MALRKCKECGREISTRAKECPGCGAPQPKGTSVLAVLGFLLIAGIVYAIVTSSESNNSSNSSNNIAPTAFDSSRVPTEPATPPLEVQSWHCDQKDSFMFVRGEVKNVSPNKLKNIAAVGTWYTKAGALIKSDDALLDYNPILPGQTSPFEVISTSNPEAQRCGLNFKNLMGGTVGFTAKSPPAPASSGTT